MRSLEALTLLTTLAVLAAPWRARQVSQAVVLIAGATALLQVAVEGARWQMAPVYTVLVVAVTLRLIGRPAPRFAAIAGRGLGLAAVALAALLAWSLPVFELPVPSGPAAVGTRYLFFSDPARGEPFTEDPADHRVLWVQAWYPTVRALEPAEPVGAGSPYLPGARAGWHASARLIGLPAFLFDHHGLVRGRATPGAPIANTGPFPVLVFSHGYGLGHIAQNTWLMQELASRGFVVFSLSHPGESISSQLPDGRSFPLDPHNARFRASWDEAADSDDEHEAKLAAATREPERLALAREHARSRPLMNDSMDLWTADTIFALDEIERLNSPGSPFEAALDLERIGLLGMSFGGATAARVCALDARCKAGLNLDGFHYGHELEAELSVPFMMIYSEGNAGMNAPLLAISRGPVHEVVLAGTTHAHFSEIVLGTGVLTRFMAPVDEPLDPWRALELTNQLAVAFFGRELQDIPAPILDGLDAPPEVTLRVRDSVRSSGSHRPRPARRPPPN